MKTNRTLLAIIALLVTVLVSAQSSHGDVSFGGSIIDEFNSFRSGVIEEFDAVQREIPDGYISFIGGKLEHADHYDDNFRPAISKPTRPPMWKPARDLSKSENIVDIDGDTSGSVEIVSPEQLTTESLAVFSKKEKTTTPESVAPVAEEVDASVPSEKNVLIDLYGIQLSWPSIDVSKLSFTTPASYRKGVKLIVDTSRLTEEIRQSAVKYSLGSWCTLLAVNKYVEKIMDEQNTPAVMTLTHYLMSDIGYDLIIGIINGNDTRLLVPFDQTVYGTDYINHDKKYYIYPKLHLASGCQVQMVNVSKSEIQDKLSFNLVVNPSFIIPRDDIGFSISDSILHLNGEVNGNLINLMKDYPLMDPEFYAMSMADSTMRMRLLEELRPQIDTLSPNDAANALLHFTHRGFEYKTDGEQFGVEKPFFVEEMFYYPFSDCEDRSILYSYLVHNLLGLDVVLLRYPNHCCTEVALPVVPDSKYGYSCIDFEGRRYYVCDPTYIGSDIGMCQKDFKGMNPKAIAKWY